MAFIPGGIEEYQDARRQASALKVLPFHLPRLEFEGADEARIDRTSNPFLVDSYRRRSELQTSAQRDR